MAFGFWLLVAGRRAQHFISYSHTNNISNISQILGRVRNKKSNLPLGLDEIGRLLGLLLGKGFFSMGRSGCAGNG